ncbi:MAG: major facilitator superfamily 1 [Candidatus Solibacter sp.]|jgi:DHA3 family macrolide efflux protein-like MFS transporter|nr:major facilitator superfamily 1 [Candidatus Solibacter sp.]
MASPTSSLGFREVLRTPAVKRLWIAQIISVFGDFLAIFAILSLVTFQLHGTAAQVAMVLVSFIAPFAIISPIAGVFVDKWDVKSTMIASDLIRGLLVMTLLFVRDIYTIYGILFVMSIFSSFFVPAQSIAVRTLAPAGGLLAVNGLMSQAMQAAQIITPSISGVLVDWLGANACFLLDSLSFFASAGLVFSLSIRRQASPVAASASSVRESFLAGFRFIFTHSAISFVMIAMACGMFGVRCFGALLSVWVRDILRSDAKLFGLLSTLIGVGMIAGTQCLRRFTAHITPQRIVVYGLAGMGLAVLVTAVFSSLIATAVGMLGLGFFAAFNMVTSQTLLQQETPQEMLGRVTSSLMSLLAISQVLAMLFAGPVAEIAGIRNLYFGSAAMLIGIAAIGLTWLRRPAADVAPA